MRSVTRTQQAVQACPASGRPPTASATGSRCHCPTAIYPAAVRAFSTQPWASSRHCGGEMHYTADGWTTWTNPGGIAYRLRVIGPEAGRPGGVLTGAKEGGVLTRTKDGGVSWEEFQRTEAVRTDWFQFGSPEVGWMET